MAIERTVEGTDPWLRGISGYRKKLRPAVLCAIDYVVELVDALPPAVEMRLSGYTDDRVMKGFFISADDMKRSLAGDRSLAEFLRARAVCPTRVVALMAMEKRERTVFGVGMAGDVVVRDVPQVTVSFEEHRFLDPTADEAETRRLLKRRAFDHLLGLALRCLAVAKSERSGLEQRRTLLQSKLNLLEREGWGFDRPEATGRPDVAAVEEQLVQIDRQLQELGGDDRMLEVYLQIVADVLGNPRQYLWPGKETIFVDRMGIRRQDAAEATELALNMLYNVEGRSQAVILVALGEEELAGL
jgi:hypothetical protein